MTYGTYCRLGVHVYDSNMTVIRQARRKIAEGALWSKQFRKMRKVFYKQMLNEHNKARGIVRKYRL